MSSRKRSARRDPSDPTNFNKEQYVEKLKEMGILVKSSWRLDMIRQLYFENVKDVSDPTQTSVQSDNDNTGISLTTPAEAQNNPSPGNKSDRTETILKETTSALKAASEALSSMTSVVKNIVQNKDNGQTNNEKQERQFDLSSAFQATYGACSIPVPASEQTFRKEINLSKGTVFAEDLPKMDYVSPKLRNQILEGKDINLALLLYPKHETPQSRLIQSEGFTVELSAPKDTRADQNLTLDEFNKAFRKYRHIICKAYPQRRDELDQYEADINDIAHSYGPKFYQYHKMFSTKAANAIIEYNVVINWGKVDDRLLHLVMHGTESRECQLCGDFDHATKFCSKQMQKSEPQRSLPEKSVTSNSESSSSATPSAAPKDKYGRNIESVNGIDICNNYNHGTCRWNQCKFIHACLTCKAKGHGFKTCDRNIKTKAYQNKANTTPKQSDK